jgi:dTDP-4-dehydrorhamnose reductase
MSTATPPKRIAITGSGGQLGSALQIALAQHHLLLLDRPDYELSDPNIAQRIADLQPDVVIHAGAMTDVEGAARDPHLAYLINGFGTQNVALACQRSGAEMVYISTNEVFDGRANQPYHEFAQPKPINPYAESKWLGEQMAQRLVSRLYVVRIAWVFAPGGNNFPAKIIRAADKFGRLKLVTDEIGNPTYAPDAAQAIAQLLETGHYGLYHLTNSQFCSRYHFAAEVLRQSGRGHIPLEPVPSTEFERLSTPPLYTPLANTLARQLGITLRGWPEALADYLAASPELQA